MEPGPVPSGGDDAGEGPSSSSPTTTAAGNPTPTPPPPPPAPSSQPQQRQQPLQQLSRYESQKRRDWNSFLLYLKNHRPPLTLPRCSGANVIEFLKYLDQFGKTKVHAAVCAYFGQPDPPAPCSCPLKQAWGSLDALIGRLRAAYEENDGQPESNPFAAKAVRIYLREVRESQAQARGIPYEKKKRKRVTRAAETVDTVAGRGESSAPTAVAAAAAGSSSGCVGSSSSAAETGGGGGGGGGGNGGSAVSPSAGEKLSAPPRDSS